MMTSTNKYRRPKSLRRAEAKANFRALIRRAAQERRSAEDVEWKDHGAEYKRARNLARFWAERMGR